MKSIIALVLSVLLTFAFVPTSAFAIETQASSVNDAITQAKNAVAGKTSKYEIALGLNDWLVTNCDYDYSVSTPTAELALESALVQKKANAQGFHEAYSRLLSEMGIDWVRVTNNIDGSSDPGTYWTWTGVKLDDGNWYNVDTAMNARLKSIPCDGFDAADAKHLYFALPNDAIGHTHQGDYTAVNAAGQRVEFNADSYAYVQSNLVDKYSKVYKESNSGEYSVRSHVGTDMEFPLPLEMSSFPDEYKNVIYPLVAYQLAQVDWDGLGTSYVVDYYDTYLQFQASLKYAKVSGVQEYYYKDDLLKNTSYGFNPPLFNSVTVTIGPKTLERGKDYNLRFDYNAEHDPGNGALHVEGFTGYCDTIERSFKVKEADEPDKPTTDEEAVKKILGDCLAKEFESNYFNAVYLHDALLGECKFIDDPSPEYSTAQSALIDGVANSRGYHEALSMLLNGIDVETELVSSSTPEGTTTYWTLAKLDGKNWVHIDAASNSLAGSNDPNTEDEADSYLKHLYFGLNDEQIKNKHASYVAAPGRESTSTDSNFYTRLEYEYPTENNTIDYVKDLVLQHYKKGEASFAVAPQTYEEAAAANIMYPSVASVLNGTKVGGITTQITYGSGYFHVKGTPEPITSCQITVDRATYTGSAIKPQVKVTIGDGENKRELSEQYDYTLAMSNNTNAGSSAKVVITGKGLFTGSITKNFTISLASITSASIDVAPQSYTGKAINVKPTVKIGNKTLKEGTDYTLTWANNINVGNTASVTVTGKGNYTGSKTKYFTIKSSSVNTNNSTNSNNTTNKPNSNTTNNNSASSGSSGNSNTNKPAITTQTEKLIPTVTGTWKKSGGKWWFAYDAATKKAQNKQWPANEWVIIKGKRYLFNSSGYMLTKWQRINNKWYFHGADGAMRTGWQKTGGKWYYMEPSTSVATSAAGVMYTGKQKISGKWYFFNTSSGAMKTGWNKESQGWFYYAGSGAMKTGWAKVGGKWYYLDPAQNGLMRTGWLDLGSKYYLNKNGVMLKGWQKIAGKDYYFYGSGILATNTWIGKYHVNANGVWDTTR